MRKLITKFMLINVGAEWIVENVPDDVKKSINKDNTDSTYLHNVDFIQLKNFLFSEKYTSNKDKIIKKLKESKNLSELNLDELKQMIPISNWERYFSKQINISQNKLNQYWKELYDLRCNVAHNKSFSKADFENVKRLIEYLKPIIETAIDNLDSIDISESERENLTNEVVGNFNPLFGKFMYHWRDLEIIVFETVDSKIKRNEIIKIPKNRSFQDDIKLLYNIGFFDDHTYYAIKRLQRTRNRLIYFDESITVERIQFEIKRLQKIIEKLKDEK